ncbi:MAG: inositol monophosphatase family protein [Chloroflexota bacterium]
MITRAPLDRSALDDVRLAAALAAGAGEVLLALRARVDAGELPADPDALRCAGDAESQAWLAAALSAARAGDAVLSEEAADDPRRLAAERVWIIDPLDGTREFAERLPDGGWRDDFAVHVALWQRGAGLTAAAVALPARGRVLDTGTASHPDETLAAAVLAGRRPIRLAVSRSHPSALAARMGERDDVTLVPMGSSGVKVAAVVEGAADAYVHAGGQHEWDTAAPVAVALAAGLTATRVDGSPLAWNQPRPWSPDLVVCAPALATHVRALLAWAGVELAGSARP